MDEWKNRRRKLKRGCWEGVVGDWSSGLRWADTRTKAYMNRHALTRTPSCLGSDFNDLRHEKCLSLIWARGAERPDAHTHTTTCRLCVSPFHTLTRRKHVQTQSPEHRKHQTQNRIKRRGHARQSTWRLSSQRLDFTCKRSHNHVLTRLRSTPCSAHSARLRDYHDPSKIDYTSKEKKRRTQEPCQMYPLYIILEQL